MDGSIPIFRLAKRGGAGLCCDARGVALGPVALVEAAEANGRRVYRSRPAEEIARTLALAYDPFSPDDLARRLSGLDVAARALEAGDTAKAAVATVLLKLPPLSADALAKLAHEPTLKKYSPDQPRDERGRWTSSSGAADANADGSPSARPVQVAANDTGATSDAGGIVPAADKQKTNDPPSMPLVLPDGTTVRNNDDNGPLMSRVRDIREVAAAGRRVGTTYQQLLHNPATAPGVFGYLIAELGVNLGHGGIFDDQREGNSVTGFKQFPQFQDVSNFNVGLFCQQAGLTREETLTVAGRFARMFSSNSRRDQPYGLHPRQKKYIEKGYAAGASGMFGPPARQTPN